MDIALASRSATGDPGVWEMAWHVRNVDAIPLRIAAAWLPHGRFRSPRRAIDPPLRLEPGDETQLAFAVQCREEPGTVVENCFVILNVNRNDAEWQVFARLTVAFDSSGAPEPETVLITAQRSASGD
jgi:hypothetical protein